MPFRASAYSPSRICGLGVFRHVVEDAGGQPLSAPARLIVGRTRCSLGCGSRGATSAELPQNGHGSFTNMRAARPRSLSQNLIRVSHVRRGSSNTTWHPDGSTARPPAAWTMARLCHPLPTPPRLPDPGTRPSRPTGDRAPCRRMAEVPLYGTMDCERNMTGLCGVEVVQPLLSDPEIGSTIWAAVTTTLASTQNVRGATTSVSSQPPPRLPSHSATSRLTGPSTQPHSYDSIPVAHRSVGQEALKTLRELT